MNKQTGYLVIAFLLGVIATQYFIRHDPAQYKVAAPVQSTQIDNLNGPVAQSVQTSQQTLKPLAVQKPSKIVSSTAIVPEKSQSAIKTPSPDETAPLQPKKRIVELTLDEQNIRDLEQSLNELTGKVVMHREDRGWRVNYLTTNNPMIRVGLQNNDLVLYELIDSAKSNPRTGPLISRLETIFSSLQ